MPLSPDEFYEHAIAAADDERRLPLSRMSWWEIFPFEPDDLRVVPLQPPTVPEPPREGEDPSTCRACTRTDAGVWHDEHWRLGALSQPTGAPLVLLLEPHEHYDVQTLPDDLAAEHGVLITHITRAVEALPHIARCHVYRIGDGGAHLHTWFFARPEGFVQLRGSCLPIWDDLLPEMPAEVQAADGRAVAEAVAASYGGKAG